MDPDKKVAARSAATYCVPNLSVGVQAAPLLLAAAAAAAAATAAGAALSLLGLLPCLELLLVEDAVAVLVPLRKVRAQVVLPGATVARVASGRLLRE